MVKRRRATKTGSKKNWFMSSGSAISSVMAVQPPTDEIDEPSYDAYDAYDDYNIKYYYIAEDAISSGVENWLNSLKKYNPTEHEEDLHTGNLLIVSNEKNPMHYKRYRDRLITVNAVGKNTLLYQTSPFPKHGKETDVEVTFTDINETMKQVKSPDDTDTEYLDSFDPSNYLFDAFTTSRFTFKRGVDESYAGYIQYKISGKVKRVQSEDIVKFVKGQIFGQFMVNDPYYDEKIRYFKINKP